MRRCFEHLLFWWVIVLAETLPITVLGAASGADDYIVEVWDSDRGLPQGSVSAIAQTPDGYLWVGTLHGGLARFDGNRFVTFHPGNTPEMKSTEVLRLTVDAEGTLWIGMVEGSILSYRGGRFRFELYSSLTPDAWLADVVAVRPAEIILSSPFGWVFRGRREGESNSWETFTPPSAILEAFVCEDQDGVIWYRRGGFKLGQIRGKEVSLMEALPGLEHQQINALARDSQGRIWVGTQKELAVWKGDRFINMLPKDGPPEIEVKQIVFGPAGEIWMRTGNGFRKWMDDQWKVIAEPHTLGQRPDLKPMVFTPDNLGGVWLSRYGEGLYYLGPDGKPGRVGAEQGMPSDLIEATLLDREGNLWVGFSDNGLACVRRRTFHVLKTEPGAVEPTVRSVCEDDQGNIWLGTAQNHVVRVTEGKASRMALPVERSAANATVVCPGRQNLWIGSVQNGVWLWETNQFRRPFGLDDIETVARAFLQDSRGRMWIGNEFGLYLWDQEKLRKFGANEGFSPAFVLALAEGAPGEIWLGTGVGELRCYKEGTFTSWRPGQMPAPAPSQMGAASTPAVGRGALSGAEQFWTILPDQDGCLWIGTLGGGLLRFKDGGFTRYGVREGLPNEHVMQLLDDENGDLWLGTRSGIARVSKQALNQFAAGETRQLSFVSYGRFDGLPTSECSGGYQPGCWKGRDGRLWFSTLKGVVWVRPREVKLNPLPPPVVIEGFWVDRELRFPQRSPAMPSLAGASSVLSISPGRHYFEIKYTALSFSSPDKVRFKWQLRGGSQELQGEGAGRSAQFGFLPPGAYDFQVQACNNDGVWNMEGASLRFAVLPYFWETWWFRTASPLLGLSLVASMVVWGLRRRHRRQVERLEQQRALDRERTRIAQDLHDDLGASLTRLRFVGALAGRANVPPQEVRQGIELMRSSAREMVIALDEIVWAVNPKNDTVPALVSYICHYAEEFLKPTGIRCRLDMPDELPNQPLASDVRHQLFLAFKEGLNNVARHSEAKEAWIRLMVTAQGLELRVEDDGRGFDLAAPTPDEADGLENMRRRLEKVGGSCHLQSSPGCGTTLRFHLPIR